MTKRGDGAQDERQHDLCEVAKNQVDHAGGAEDADQGKQKNACHYQGEAFYDLHDVLLNLVSSHPSTDAYILSVLINNASTFAKQLDALEALLHKGCGAFDLAKGKIN